MDAKIKMKEISISNDSRPKMARPTWQLLVGAGNSTDS